jgi:hypothetical protein
MNAGPEWAVELLCAQHPDVPRERLETLAHEEYQELSRNATVKSHLTALTLNRCNRRLRDLDGRSGRHSLHTAPAA